MIRMNKVDFIEKLIIGICKDWLFVKIDWEIVFYDLCFSN